MRNPYEPYQDELTAATPNPPPKSDYAEIAARGMRHLRQIMGWNTPSDTGSDSSPENPSPVS